MAAGMTDKHHGTGPPLPELIAADANCRKYPAVIHMSEFWVRGLSECQAGLPDGRWVPARALPFYSLFGRWHAAWLVFTGRADALLWPGQ
jgi:hypothetical protein